MSKTIKAKPLAAAPLSRKLRPSRTYRLHVDEPTPDQHAALAEARHELRMALVGDDPDRQKTARALVEQAQADLDGCWRDLVLYSVPNIRALVAEHPPTEDQAEAGSEWNPATFPPALIAAAAEQEGLTAGQWAEELGSDRWSEAERQELFELALEASVGESAHARSRRESRVSSLLR